MPKLSIPYDILTPVKLNFDEDFEVKEVSRFSKTQNKIIIDDSELYTFQIPEAKNNACPYGLNTALGHHGYKPKVFGRAESTIGDFITALLQINETQNGTRHVPGGDYDVNLRKCEVFAPSAFFQYVATQKMSTFYIINVNNRIVIANAERRELQDVKMSYVGIRFEDLLHHGTHFKTVNNLSFYDSIIETKVAGMNCLFFAEVDSKDPHSGDYTEIKMILCKGSIPHHRMTNKREILRMLANGNNYFSDFLLRLLVQCKLSLEKKVLIGIRDASFNIKNITLFSVDEDLIPFFKSRYAEDYKIYTHSLDSIDRVLKEIKIRCTPGAPVLKLKVGYHCTLETVDESSERVRILQTVLTEEFYKLLKEL